MKKDSLGRPYDVHHIDGNPKNNTPDNIKYMSLFDHFQYHISRGEIKAAQTVARRMSIVDKQREYHVPDQQTRIDIAGSGGASTKGMRWYNNGAYDIKSPIPPRGKAWKPGRLPFGGGSKLGDKNGKFYNNGTKTIRSLEHPGDGWVVGRLNPGSPNKGVKQSPEWIANRMKKMRGRKHKQIKCPVCGKVGGISGMKAWHFDNCRYKTTS